MSERRVVITGIGPVTPIGEGKDAFWQSMKTGTSGIKKVTIYDLDEPNVDVKIGGEVTDFDISNYYSDPKQVRGMNKDMDRVTQFAVAAAKLAIEDSKINLDATDRTRCATYVGTGIGGLSTTCNDATILKDKGQKRLGVRSIIRLMPNAPSGFIGILHGLKGRSKSDSTACASGLDSLMDAYMYIKDGFADLIVSGGSEACLTPLSLASFSNMTALSKRECDPQEASCPFDKRRDGFVMSEGAIVFTLEELEHAKARGAHIYAEVVGVGASCDAYHITAPCEDGDGSARAIEMALQTAGLNDNREAIDYIHAHGTSTPLNDARETLAIKKVFGDHAHKLCVSSTKSMTGHLIGAAGPSGVAATALAIQHSLVPPTINYREPDPACDLNYVPNEAESREVNYALIQALGFGGHNTVIALKKYSA